MASPTKPPAGSPSTSPPQPSGLALPRQRPTLVLPTGQPSTNQHPPPKSRKPSIASATPITAHPLRQTSFPPTDSLEAQHAAASGDAAALLRFSPSQTSPGGPTDADLDDDFSGDDEIVSALSGPTAGSDDTFGAASGMMQAAQQAPGKKRKRGEKRPRGRPAKNPPATNGMMAGTMRPGSVASGEDASGQAGSTANSGRRGGAGGSTLAGGEADNEPADDDDEEEDLGAGGVGSQNPYDSASFDPNKEHYQKSVFRAYLGDVDRLPLSHPSRRGMTAGDMQDRFDTWNKTKLRSAEVRRLVNQTLSQSVPANVVTVVSAYAKMFAGLMVEGAREVQGEWGAVEEKRPDGGENETFERLRKVQKMMEEELDATMDAEEPAAADDAAAADAVAEPSQKSPASQPAPTKTSPTRGSPDETAPQIKTETHSTPSHPPTPTQPDQTSPPPHPPQETSTTPKPPSAPIPAPTHLDPHAQNLTAHLSECDRGPLQPDHLREALRRYRKARSAVGVTGMSLEGREGTAARMGGRRMFK